MTRDQIVRILESIIDAHDTVVAKLTDIWLCPEWMEVLDPRPPLERLTDFYTMDGIYVTAHYKVTPGTVKVAFTLIVEEDNETITND